MPLSSPYTVLATAGRTLDEFSKLIGVDLRPLAASVGIDVGIFQHPTARISLDAFTRLLHILETVSGDDCTGLRYGAHCQLGNSGAFGFAILNAPNLREALKAYSQYQQLIVDYVFFDVELETAESTVQWRYAGIVQHAMHFVYMRAVLLCKVLRRFLGQEWFPSRVALVRPAPSNTTLHRKLLSPNIVFEQFMNSISFNSRVLDQVNTSADPRLFEMMIASCEAQLAALQADTNWIVAVKREILSVLPSNEATLIRITAKLGISERSLQRRLSECETSFEKIVEETRRELSDRLLMGNKPLSEISYLCGYANPSAYSRAAKAWYGAAPQEYRRQLQRSET